MTFWGKNTIWADILRKAVAGNAPEFEPSPHLVAQIDRARRLDRNIRRSSSFNARLHRRAYAAGIGASALGAHERRAFKEANA